MYNKFIYSFFILIVSFFLSCDKTETNPTPDPDPKPEPDKDLPAFNLKKVDFAESDAIIFNPERGFYKFAEFTSSNSNVQTVSGLNAHIEEGRSLIYNTYTMPDYRDKLIPQVFLDRIKTNMQALREAGLKTVLRFRYTNSESQKPWDPTAELVDEHIQQLTPIFQEYADVIYILEAGFIGVWGEWYYTDNFIFQPKQDEYAPRRAVLDALLSALPKKRMVAVRYPAAKLFSYDITVSDTLTLQRAYDGSDLSRVAFHNDCFLADQDDRGTFGGRRSFRNYWASESKYVGMGGETCQLSSFSECSNALLDMAKYHWSFLNESYHPSVISDWKTKGCMAEIQKRLGYRFVLTDGKFPEQAIAGEEFQVDLNLKNVGFAAPFNPRGVEIILVSKTSKQEYKLKLDNDPRFWFPEESVNIKTSFGIPRDIAVGEYDLYLNLPDPEPTLYGNPKFSIQLANENVWDEEKGYNKIYSVLINKANSKSDYKGPFIEKSN